MNQHENSFIEHVSPLKASLLFTRLWARKNPLNFHFPEREDSFLKCLSEGNWKGASLESESM